jgi:hypothetical protein
LCLCAKNGQGLVGVVLVVVVVVVVVVVRSRVEGHVLAAGCGDQDAIMDPVLAGMDVTSVGLIP